MSIRVRKETGFTFAELTIALLLTSVLGIFAYRVVLSNSRAFQSAGRKQRVALDWQQVEALLRDEIRRSLLVSSGLGFEGQVIRTTVTPLERKDVDGNPIPEGGSIRIVVPRPIRGVTAPLRLADDMAGRTGPVRIAGAPSESCPFPRGTFLLIGTIGLYEAMSDVFLVTGCRRYHDGLETGFELEHSASEGAGWNHSDGLQMAYESGALLQPVRVVTFGPKLTPAGTVLVRRQDDVDADGNPTVSDTVLADHLKAFRVAYFRESERNDPKPQLDPEVDPWKSIRFVELGIAQRESRATAWDKDLRARRVGDGASDIVTRTIGLTLRN